MQRAKWMFVGVFLLMAGPLFAQVNVAGDWEITLKTPQGDSTAMATLKQDGEKVSGVLKNQMGELPFDGGTLTGDQLKFVFTVNFQGTPIPITLTGKVKGAAIDGEADFGGMAQGDWTAKRVESTTANGAAPAAATPAAATPAAAAAPAATGGGIAGKWDITFRTPQGDFPAVATIAVDSGKISGSMGSQLGETPITGTLDGMKVAISLNVESPQGSMSVAMTGEVQGSDAMAGMADVAGMGQMEWSAKRSKQ